KQGFKAVRHFQTIEQAFEDGAGFVVVRRVVTIDFIQAAVAESVLGDEQQPEVSLYRICQPERRNHSRSCPGGSAAHRAARWCLPIDALPIFAISYLLRAHYMRARGPDAENTRSLERPTGKSACATDDTRRRRAHRN